MIDRRMRRDAPADLSPEVYAAATASIAVDPLGPLYDDHAQALALDAMSAVDAQVAWNSLTMSGMTTYEVRVNLSRNGIDSTDDWVAHLGDCLDPGMFGDLGFVLDARAEMMRRDGRPVDPAQWGEELHDYLDVTAQNQGAHDAVDAIIASVVEVDDRIAAAGLLPAGTALRSVIGVQCSRVVSSVRWGAQSGYGDRDAVAQGLMAARDLAGANFADWTEFGVSVLAGWVLAEAPEQRRAAWDAGLPALATLLTAPDSPWRNLDFPFTADFTGLPDLIGDD